MQKQLLRAKSTEDKMQELILTTNEKLSAKDLVIKKLVKNQNKKMELPSTNVLTNIKIGYSWFLIFQVSKFCFCFFKVEVRKLKSFCRNEELSRKTDFVRKR